MTEQFGQTTVPNVESSQKAEGKFLEIDHVTKRFYQSRSGLWSRLFHRGNSNQLFVSAVDDVSLKVSVGETLVILGESGSGKTTLGRMIVGLERSDSGKVSLGGEDVKFVRDRGANRGRLQMVFQDPGSSLDPYMSVSSCVAEPIKRMGLSSSEITARTVESLSLVGLDESSFYRRKASDLSGGQKQRVAIARSLISNPDVIVLDEPTSSIDVSIQAQVLNLLVDLQKMKGLTYVMISHDPNVARFMADNIAVMHLGKIVEYGPCEPVLNDPKHPYTQALLASAPKIGSTLSIRSAVGDPQSMIILPKGCRFEPRCPYAMEKCGRIVPALAPAKGDATSLVACFLYSGDDAKQ
jgi:oligopeptide/dipeptide ABC transporter ATP-binding protein